MADKYFQISRLSQLALQACLSNKRVERERESVRKLKERMPIYLDENITVGAADSADTIEIYCEHHAEDNDDIYRYTIPYVVTCSICCLQVQNG